MIKEIARITGVSEEEIRGKSRVQHISDARHLLFVVMYENKYRLVDIERITGKHHSTVIWGIKSFKNILNSGDPIVNEWYSMAKNIKR